MNKLNTIRDKVIKEGFPELMKEDIRVEYKKIKRCINGIWGTNRWVSYHILRRNKPKTNIPP
jgi:hypothetical protein